MAIIFSTTTLQKEGILQDGDVTYSINITAINNKLAKLPLKNKPYAPYI